MTEETERRDTPTIEAPPLGNEEATGPEHEIPVQRTALRPPPADPWDTSFLEQDDSVFSTAVTMMAKAARANEKAAAQRATFEAEHLGLQRSILTCVERAEKNQTANSAIVRDAIDKLKKADEHHDNQFAGNVTRFEQIEKSIGAVKLEILNALPGAITTILAPYLERIEGLERELEVMKANVPAGTPPPPTP